MRPEDLPTAMPGAPNLVLLPSAASVDTSDLQLRGGDPSILGLSLVRRTVLAARRAGYGQVFFLSRDHAAPGTDTIADWNRIADALRPHEAARLVIAPATILSETGWLKMLAAAQIEPAAWAAKAHRIVVTAATVMPDALALLQAEGGAYDMAAVEDRLTHRFGSAAPVSNEIDPIVVATSQDLRIAERRLLQSAVKDTDGFMARHVDRKISLAISRRLAPTAVTPTQVTLVSIAIGLCGAPFFLSAHWYWQTAGALLFLLHSIVDGCDGELARLKFQESRYGGILDFWGDNIVHLATFACIAAGWALSANAAWPLLLGAAAVAGTMGSASFLYWQRLRTKDGSGPLFTSVSSSPDDWLARMLDAGSRRDFIYVAPVFALFGKANWLVLLIGVGAPAYFLLLVLLAMHERLQVAPTRSGA
jgi:1L-myo-inositol 1-phosphate cytidylyltransferase / CDP-L-myo-inositol myo-inositolphosphotransferase